MLAEIDFNSTEPTVDKLSDLECRVWEWMLKEMASAILYRHKHYG